MLHDASHKNISFVACLVFIGIGIVLCVVSELCIEIAAVTFTDGGGPFEKKGSISIEQAPTSEQEAFLIAGRTLQDIGWWDSQSVLVTMNRKLDCHQISPPSGVWSLGFIKFSRVTLFSGFFHTANVDIDNDHLVLNYFLADYDIERIRHPTGISFDQMEINTDQALDLAERNGGEKLRGIINNQCFVSFYIDDNSEYWGVDYDRTLADKLLCFDVEFRTGEINSVAQRGSYPCQYFGLSGD